MNISDLQNLSAQEKLELVVRLWDDIAESGESITLSDAVLDEAQRRSDELKSNPSIAIDDEEMWRRVDG